VRSPWSGDFLTVLCRTGHGGSDEWHTVHASCEGVGFFVHRSAQGPDGLFTSSLISRHTGFVARQPLPCAGASAGYCRCSDRWRASYAGRHAVGRRWRYLARGHASSPPPNRVEWPHAGVRWQNYGCEPTVVELSDGRLWMLIRTSQDCHYEAFSEDSGESWTTPVPSRFYATITMPLLFRMNDGRLLIVWNNSTPLPELDHNAAAGTESV